MVFSSGIFLIYFLPLIITGYFFVPQLFRNAYLLLFSLFFYWWGAPSFIWIVLAASGANFFIAQYIPQSVKPKLLLALYITINLGILCYFKYANFFIENVNEALISLGMNAVSWTNIALPVGVSFFTFQSITYGVDIYRNEAPPQKNILNYWLYILFFPQLIAGPIVTYKSISKQLTHRESSMETFLDGCVRFIIGLAKKVLIANVMAEFGKELDETNAGFYMDSTSVAWLTALAYTFEIYFDFSGYSDMAIGLGQLFGFTFPENFNRPYLSKSITEFWRRWHITLGDFMRNYLYIPLGGNRKNVSRTYINLASVFILSGLWHGASWNFVAWGFFHGVWLVLERMNPWKLNQKFNFFKIAFTFVIVVHGWVLFDANSMQEAMNHLKIMYSFDNMELMMSKNNFYYYAHLVIAILVCVLGFSPKANAIYSLKISTVQNSFAKIGLTAVIGILFLLCLSHVVAGSFNPFIYFKF